MESVDPPLAFAALFTALAVGALVVSFLPQRGAFDDSGYRASADLQAAFQARSRRAGSLLAAAVALAGAGAGLLWTLRIFEPLHFLGVLVCASVAAGFVYLVHRRHVSWPCPRCGGAIRRDA